MGSVSAVFRKVVMVYVSLVLLLGDSTTALVTIIIRLLATPTS